MVEIDRLYDVMLWFTLTIFTRLTLSHKQLFLGSSRLNTDTSKQFW